MTFALIVLIFWAVYMFIMKRNSGKEFMISKSLMPLILICIISTICLGVNYVAATVPNLNDGLAINNFLSYWIIREDNWSVQLFKSYFDSSVYISLVLVLIYSVLTLLKK
ncbi:hypothetical protein CLHOM_34110 [Clostridium homopropionicum DSM 5847]|uniref:Uncharacterized protein n=1 Tax=Clostridium homopropionicum DSM 5847 TaxID=1121318 RepID=A0A0L6Z6B2_9CLOT|nr:hypothetical protein [Clostridium homopropionicum]KOA18509.1 hypothetical protein CLHOM_34110 [Clostridium homopropionicum DSM 5847]SFF65658.1 hypothetical protein SAMN04488501_10169 [Clostridium homopropionicum]